MNSEDQEELEMNMTDVEIQYQPNFSTKRERLLWMENLLTQGR